MALMWYSSMDALLAKCTNPSSIANVYPVYSGPFPLVDADDTTRNDIELVNSKIFRVTIGADHYAVVVLCKLGEEAGVKKPLWSIYCGDKQVDGTFVEDGKTLAGRLKSVGVVSKKVIDALQASAWVNVIPDTSPCAFFKMQRTPPHKICTHTQAVLKNTPKVEFEQMVTPLTNWLSGKDEPAEVVPQKLSVEEEAFYDAAFIQHVLLVGERGSGKSYLARQAASRFGAVYLEMQMHQSMEAWEFRAHDRAWNGKVFQVLGKLAEAVYWIQQGKKVVLCMDEFLNMNPTYTTAINSPLTLTANDTYIIETGRIVDMGDGVGSIETVEVPADMLWVVATSNVGARYGLDKITPSVRARFQIIVMNTNAERTKTILGKTLEKYEMPLEIADMFKKFIDAVNTAVVENNLDEEATTRLACNVIRSVYMKSVRDNLAYTTLAQWLPAVKKQLTREIAQVVNFETGPLAPDQKSLFEAIVNRCFRIK